MLKSFLHGPRCLPQAHRSLQQCNNIQSQYSRRLTTPATASVSTPVDYDGLLPSNRAQDGELPSAARTSAGVSVRDGTKIRGRQNDGATISRKPSSLTFRKVGYGPGAIQGKVPIVQDKIRRALKGDRISRGFIAQRTVRHESYSGRTRRIRTNRTARVSFQVVKGELGRALPVKAQLATWASASSVSPPRDTHNIWRSRTLSKPGSPRARLQLVRQKRRPGTKKSSKILMRRMPKLRKIRTVQSSPPSVQIDVYGRMIRKPETSIISSRPIKRDHFLSLGSWSQKTEDAVGAITSGYSNSNLDPIDIAWSTQYTRISQGQRINLWISPNIGKLVATYASLSTSRRRLHLAWVHLPESVRARLWQDVMLWCLQNSPKRALHLLLAIFRGRRYRPARNVAEDCLKFLVIHYLQGVSDPEPWAFDGLRRLISRFVDGGSENSARISSLPQIVVFSILRHCGDAGAINLYRLLIQNQAFLHVNTMLHFLERFAEMGKIGLSMKLLGLIARSGSDMSRDQIQSACVRLLRARWELADAYPIQAKITTQMLEMGIRPNTQMFNCILLNTVEAQNFDLAMRMFEDADRAGFATDSITHGILLKVAKLSGNVNILRLILEKTNVQPEMIQDLRFVGELFHAIGVFSPHDEYNSKLELYTEHFDLRPLQQLGLCEADSKPPPGKDVNERWPTNYILGQMIMAYNQASQSSVRLIDRYLRFHDLVRAEHPLFAPLARDEHVPNSFIMAMGRKSETLQHCTTVVKHMLEAPPSKEYPPYAPPSVRTWTILASSYFHKRQRRAGEKVITMMKERGLEPDKVTWDTIVNGYAMSQDVDAAVDSVKRMEASGYEVDSTTLKKLGRLYNRNRLLDALKSRIELQEESVESEKPVEHELVAPEEVDNMAQDWEAKPSDRETEVKDYLTSYYKERIGMEGEGPELMGERLERLERELSAVDAWRKSDVN